MNLSFTQRLTNRDFDFKTFENNKLYKYFLDPVEEELMDDPVTCPSGAQDKKDLHTLDKRVLRSWIDRCVSNQLPATSPITGAVIQYDPNTPFDEQFPRNMLIAQMIDDFVTEYELAHPLNNEKKVEVQEKEEKKVEIEVKKEIKPKTKEKAKKSSNFDERFDTVKPVKKPSSASSASIEHKSIRPYNLVIEPDMKPDIDYVLIIDKSGSMDKYDGNSVSRWKAASEIAYAFAVEFFRNLNGRESPSMDVYFFSNEYVRRKVKYDEEVKEMFKKYRPGGSTDLARVLHAAFSRFVKQKNKGRFSGPMDGKKIIVITDGEPNDPKAVKNEIVQVSNYLDRYNQLDISFLQIGDDLQCSEFLEDLNDDTSPKFDIVDIVSKEEVIRKISNYNA